MPVDWRVKLQKSTLNEAPELIRGFGKPQKSTLNEACLEASNEKQIFDRFFDRRSCPLFKILINNSHRTCLHFHVTIQTNSMEYSSIGEFDTIVNCFMDADQLMDFTATWGIQDSPVVLLRLYRLRKLDHDDTLINEQIFKLVIEQDNRVQTIWISNM